MAGSQCRAPSLVVKSQDRELTVRGSGRRWGVLGVGGQRKKGAMGSLTPKIRARASLERQVSKGEGLQAGERVSPAGSLPRLTAYSIHFIPLTASEAGKAEQSTHLHPSCSRHPRRPRVPGPLLRTLPVLPQLPQAALTTVSCLQYGKRSDERLEGLPKVTQLGQDSSSL